MLAAPDPVGVPAGLGAVDELLPGGLSVDADSTIGGDRAPPSRTPSTNAHLRLYLNV